MTQLETALTSIVGYFPQYMRPPYYAYDTRRHPIRHRLLRLGEKFSLHYRTKRQHLLDWAERWRYYLWRLQWFPCPSEEMLQSVWVVQNNVGLLWNGLSVFLGTCSGSGEVP